MFYLGRCYTFYVAIVIFAVAPKRVATFSFDSENLILYEDAARSNQRRSSYFGYSLALWSSGNKDLNGSWIFIGAPRANSSRYPNAREPGTVFKCEIGKPCTEWSFEHSSIKPGDGSWLGGSIMTEKRSDANVLVCGPKWLDVLHSKTNQPIPMTGVCYKRAAKENNSNQDKTTIGISGNGEGYNSNGLGASIHIPDDSLRNAVIGGPVQRWGRGALTEIQWTFDGNQRSNLLPFRPLENSAYAGYAITSGYYFNTFERITVTGAPRTAKLRGSVFESNFRNGTISSLGSGEQAGEYYGYALASCDVNGDGRDELLVGAPHWTKDVDEGRVYVLTGRRDKTFAVASRLEGRTPRGRFGSTITCLGDVDFDGYADVAVGAPYAGSGSVFVYRGSRSGLSNGHSQKIPAPESTKGFGISISEPRDVDHNGYADIAVGAYLSGHVALIRSKRVVTTKVTLKSDTRQITLQSDPFVFTITVCSSYKGVHVEKELSVENELTVDEVYNRAKVVIAKENKQRHIFVHTLQKSKPNCENFLINVTKNDNIRQAIKLSVTQTFNESPTGGILRIGKDKITGKDLFCHDCVVIDPLWSTVRAEHDVTLAAKCGSDSHTCRSKLKIVLETVDEFVIDSSPGLTLNISVKNAGEPAYHTKAMIRVPISLTVVDSVGCTDGTATGNYTEITCQIANPLETDKAQNISIYLDVSTIPWDTEKLDFTAKATTESDDISEGTSKTHHSIACRVETDVGISRKSTMDTIGFARTDQIENLPNKSFEHTYLVMNYGRTPISKVVLGVSVPTHWIQADEEIEVVRISEIRSKLDGNQLICENATENEGTEPSARIDATTMTKWLDEDSPSTNTKFSVIEGKVFSSYPDNRTIYVNSTNPSFKWRTINCEVAPFQSTQSVAEVTFAFELMLAKFPPKVIQAKDIIFFVTNGSIVISSLNVIDRQTVNNASDAIMIGTVLTGTQIEHRIAIWILVLAVFLALLLLILITLGLLKFGFFKRSKKLELQALLQQQTDESTGTAGQANNATE
ncbi:integrin alpha-PS5-like [Neodiprion pinetum]|uniref:integrin alpha-PS5-like n=1 Tax=Neodiprion pinetum TaxID=441929 RepID=UPI001EDFB6D8|nr:integrin alpha-PS5-like [Neodiprion pinetum]XP_046490040.1 integrin alpha-PS5-like [Neodiprion pinetum]